MFLAGLGSEANAADPVTGGSPKSVRIGFKASPNFCTTHIMEGNMKNNGLGLGFSYGIMADINIAKNPAYWFGTELIISSMPVSVKSTDTLYNGNVAPGAAFTNAKFDYRLQYIQIPLTIKLKTGEIGRLSYYGQFGLAPSVLIQNKLTTSADQPFYAKGSSNHSPNSASNDALDFPGNTSGVGAFRDNVSFVRLPLIIGLGIEGKISGSTSYIAGLRWDNAFTDLFRDSKVKGRNNYLGVQLGIFF